MQLHGPVMTKRPAREFSCRGTLLALFRWRLVSLGLIAVGVVYLVNGVVQTLFALLALDGSESLGYAASVHSSPERLVVWLLWGAFWSLSAGSLCLYARGCMANRTHVSRRRGLGALFTALVVITVNWLRALVSGTGSMLWIELLFVLPVISYAVVFATIGEETQMAVEPREIRGEHTLGKRQ